MSGNDDHITKVRDVLQVHPETARQYLALMDWDVDAAILLYLSEQSMSSSSALPRPQNGHGEDPYATSESREAIIEQVRSATAVDHHTALGLLDRTYWRVEDAVTLHLSRPRQSYEVVTNNNEFFLVCPTGGPPPCGVWVIRNTEPYKPPTYRRRHFELAFEDINCNDDGDQCQEPKGPNGNVLNTAHAVLARRYFADHLHVNATGLQVGADLIGGCVKKDGKIDLHSGTLNAKVFAHSAEQACGFESKDRFKHGTTESRHWEPSLVEKFSEVLRHGHTHRRARKFFDGDGSLSVYWSGLFFLRIGLETSGPDPFEEVQSKLQDVQEDVRGFRYHPDPDFQVKVRAYSPR